MARKLVLLQTFRSSSKSSECNVVCGDEFDMELNKFLGQEIWCLILTAWKFDTIYNTSSSSSSMLTLHCTDLSTFLVCPKIKKFSIDRGGKLRNYDPKGGLT